LELAQRQLNEEADDSTEDQLAEIEEEIAKLQHELASLREQWETERLGVSGVQEMRQKYDQLELEFKKLEALD
jgi:ATP-dependent Clp protease ATP-binding subunit ClpB